MFSVAHNHLQYRQYLYFSHTISENRQVISLGDITYSYPHAFDTHVKATSYGPVSVCLSVTSRCSIKTDGRIELVFGMEACDLSYIVL